MNASKILIILPFVFISCGGDDNSEDPLIGTWRSETLSQTDCDNGAPDIVDFRCGGCATNVFRSDGTFTSSILIPGVLEQELEGTYTQSGSTLTTCDENGENCEVNSFSIVDDQLTLTGEVEGCNLTINFEKS